MTWESTTSDADPGAGKIAWNHATIASATILYVDDADDASADITAYVQSWDDVTNAVARGIVTITKEGTASTYATFKVTGAVTDATGYTKVPVTHVVSSGSFSDDDGVGVHFEYSGADGTGDITSVVAGTGLSGGGTSGDVTLNSDLLGKQGGTNFTNSLLVGHSTTGTLSSAESNIGIGATALDAITSGDNNVCVGVEAGTAITGGANNVGIGKQALKSITNADNNTAVGNESLELATASNNIGLGSRSGDNITSGAGNVIIGSINADSATGDKQLIIADGTDGSVAWIKGDSSGNILNGSTAINIAGKQTIWIPAQAMFGTTTNGADAQAVETTATRPELKVLDFDAGTAEYAQFSIAMPKSWNLSTVTYQVFWSPSNTNTGNCIFGLQGLACTEGDTADAVFGTAVEVTDAGIATIEDVQMTAVSSAVTIAGTPADDDIIFFQLYRDAADGSDTFTGDARVMGIKLFYTTDAANDA
mgnify:CR=1 FL=1